MLPWCCLKQHLASAPLSAVHGDVTLRLICMWWWKQRKHGWLSSLLPEVALRSLWWHFSVLRQDVGMVSGFLAECGKSKAAADLGPAWLQEGIAIHRVIKIRKALSPTIPHSHVPKCHIHAPFEYFLGWCTDAVASAALVAEGLFLRLKAAADLAESAGHKMKFTVITGI